MSGSDGHKTPEEKGSEEAFSGSPLVYLKGVRVTPMEIMTDGKFTQEYIDYVLLRGLLLGDNG